MGITIRCGKESFDIGYIGFNSLRQDIIKNCLDKNGKQGVFYKDKKGKVYNNIYENISELTAGNISVHCTNEIFYPLFQFVIQSDIKGKLNQKQSKVILKILKNNNYLEKINQEGCTDCESYPDIYLKFYKMLEMSAKSRRNIYWE